MADGPAVGLLLSGGAHHEDVAALQQDGVACVACANSMRALDITDEQLAARRNRCRIGGGASGATAVHRLGVPAPMNRVIVRFHTDLCQLRGALRHRTTQRVSAAVNE